MRANPAISTDIHPASDHGARSDPTARSYFCSGLNHSKRPDLRRRIDQRPIRHNCRRVNTWRQRWHRIEQRSDTCPGSVRFARYDRHRCRWHARCHVGMYDHGTGRTSDPVPKHNAGYPENLFHSGPPSAEGLYLRGAARLHLRHRAPHSQRQQVDTVHFGERTSGCPNLLRSSPSTISKSSSTTVYFDSFDVKGKGLVWVKTPRSARLNLISALPLSTDFARG